MFSFSGYDAVIITDEKQIFYFAGYKAEGYLLITENQNYFCTDKRYFYAVEKAVYGTKFKAVIGSWEFLKDYCEKSGIKRLGVDYSVTTLEQSYLIRKCCSCLKDVSDEIKKQTLIKTDAEIEKIRKACLITEQTFLEVVPYIKEGVTELDLRAELEYRFLKKGASGTSFEPIVAFGENSAVPHHQTGNTRLEKNKAVLFDIGCVLDGYCSDFTRTLFFGQPDKDFLHAYSCVYDAFFNAYNNIKTGMTCSQADNLARSVLESENLPFTHSLGHGVGINIHETPYLRKNGNEILKEASVFTIEPGCYLDGKFGIRLEDTCYLKNGKVNNFYSLDKKLKVIE